jgi:hypothetical protein
MHSIGIKKLGVHVPRASVCALLPSCQCPLLSVPPVVSADWHVALCTDADPTLTHTPFPGQRKQPAEPSGESWAQPVSAANHVSPQWTD